MDDARPDTHHTVDTVLVSGKFCDLHGVVRIGDVPDTNVRHVAAFAGGQELAVPGERQGGHGLATGVQHVCLGVFPWIEQHDGAAATGNDNIFLYVCLYV